MASAMKYLSNVAKSVKYASIDVFKDMNPVITDGIETNADVAKVTYSSIKNFKAISTKAMKSLSNSQVGELAKEAKRNLLEDIKNGTFYNKEREASAFNDIGDNFLDEDLGDFMVDDTEEDFSVVEAMDNVGEKTSSAISNVLARTAEYQVEATRQSTTRMLAQQAAMTATLHSDLSVVNANIAGVVKFNNESMSTHIENSRLFYETQQKQMDEQTSILREMLEIQKSIYTPTKSTSSKMSASDIFTGTGMVNLGNYFSYVKQNIKENDSGMGDILEMVQGMGLGKGAVANPLGTVMKMALSSLTPKDLKAAMLEFNESIAGSISTALINITKSQDSGNSVLSALGNIFGLNLTTKKGLDSSKYNKDATPWTGKDHKALTMVIPTLLGKIYSAVSGSEETRFDYESGKFKTINQIRKDYDNIRNSYVSQANESIIPGLEKQIGKVKFTDQKQKDQFMKDLDTIMKQNFDKMQYFNPKDKSLSAKTYGLKGDMSEYNFKLIQQMYKNLPTSKQLKAQTDLIEAVQAQNERLERMESSGDSIFTSLFNDDEASKSSKTGKSSPIFSISSKIDTTNDILSQILEAITKTKRPKTKNKTKETNNVKIVSTATGSSDSHEDQYESELNINPNIMGTNTMNYGDDIDLSEGDNVESAYLAGIRKATTATGKLKAFMKGFNTLANQPVKFMGNVLRKVDTRLYTLLFGAGANDEDSITGKIKSGFDKWFEDLKVTTKQKFGDIRDALGRSGVGDKAKGIIHSVFGIDIDEWVNQFKDAMFGNKDKSLVSGMKDVFKQGFSDIFNGVKSFFKPGKDWAKDQVFGRKNEQGKKKQERYKTYDSLGKILGRGGFNRGTDDGTGETSDIPNAASGMRRVSKTGVVAVSEGEMILPPDLNPNNISKREKNEKSAISKFKNVYGDIGKIKFFAEGGTVGDDNSNKRKDAGYQRIINYLSKKLKSGEMTEEEAVQFINKFVKDEDDYNALLNKITSLRRENKTTRDDYEQGHENIMYRMGDELKSLYDTVIGTDFAKNVSSKLGSLSKGKSGAGKDAVQDVVANFKDYLPRIAAGGVTGAGLSLLLGLAGGPVLGGAVGAGLGLLSNSQKVQKWLFGEKVLDEEGNETGKRDGSGIISKNITQNIDKYFPNMAKGAVVGGITSLLPFVPGGPVAGIVVGSAVGFARSNERLKNALFGEDKVLSKMKKKIEEKLPKMGLGAAAMMLGGPFGLTTNLMVGAGLGFVSDTEKFKEIIFGTKGVDGKRAGGLVGFIKDATEIPINGVKKLFNETIQWFKTDILDPIKTGMSPFIQQFKNMGNWVKDTLKDAFHTHITKPIGVAINERIIRPLENTIGKFLLKPLIGAFKKIVSAPFKAFGAAGEKLRRRQLSKVGAAGGTAASRVAQRAQLDQNGPGLFRRTVNRVTGRETMSTARYTDTEANNLDVFLSSASNEELEQLRNVQQATDTRLFRRNSAEKIAKEAVSRGGLGQLLLSHVNRKNEAGVRQLERADMKLILDEVTEGKYENSVRLIRTSPTFPEELKEKLIKKIKDTAKKRNKAYEDAVHARELAEKFKREHGFDITSRAAGRVTEDELQARQAGNTSQNDYEESTEDQLSGDSLTPQNINIALKLDEKHRDAMEVLHSIDDSLYSLAYPGSRRARRSKRNEEENSNTESQLPMVITAGDIIQAAQTGDMSAAQRMANGEVQTPSKLKTIARGLVNRVRNAAHKAKSVMTEHGVIKFRTNAQGEEIPDERDSETQETMNRQNDSSNTQKGILSKLSNIGSGIKKLFGGEDDSDASEDHKKGIIGTLLGLGKGAMGLLGSKAGLILGALGLTTVAGMKIKRKRKDENGNVVTDENGNPVYDETTIGEAVSKGVHKVWMGSDGTGNTDGVWFHIKGFATKELIPAFQSGFDMLIDNIPYLVEKLIENLPRVLGGVGKGILNAGANLLGIGGDEGRSDTQSSSNIEKSYTVTGINNASSTGSLLASSANTNTSSTTKENSSRTIVSSAPILNSSGTVVNNTTTTSTSTEKSPTLEFKSKGSVSSAKSSTKDDKIIDEIMDSKAYNAVNPNIQQKVLEQLVSIWNEKIVSGQTVKELLNDDSTQILEITDPSTGQSIPITGAEILKYPQAANLLGLDTSLTDEERTAYTKQLGYTQNRGALIQGITGVTRALLMGGHGGAGVKLVISYNNFIYKSLLGRVPVIGKYTKVLSYVANAPAYAATAASKFSGAYRSAGTVKGAAKEMFENYSTSFNEKRAMSEAEKASKKANSIKGRMQRAYAGYKENGVKGAFSGLRKDTTAKDMKKYNKQAKKTAKANAKAAKAQATEDVLNDIRSRDYGKTPKANATGSSRSTMSFGADDIDILDADGNVLRSGSSTTSLATTGTNAAADLADDATSTVSRLASNATTELSTDVAGTASRSAANNAGKDKGFIQKAIDWVSGALKKFFKESKVVNKIQKAIEKGSTIKNLAKDRVAGALLKLADKLVERFTKGLAGAAAKVIAKVSTKLAGAISTGMLSVIVLAVADFLMGFKNADAIMGVSSPNMMERVISGIVNAISGNLLFGIIPADTIISMVTNFIEGLGVNMEDFRKRQAEAEEDVRKYNEENGTNYSVYEYFMKDKVETKIKNFVSKVWNSRLMSPVKGTVDTVLNVGKGVLGGAWETVKGVGKGLWNAGKGIVGGVGQLVTGHPIEAVKSIGGGIVDGVKSIGSGLWEGGKKVVGGVVDGGKSFINGITKFVSGKEVFKDEDDEEDIEETSESTIQAVTAAEETKTTTGSDLVTDASGNVVGSGMDENGYIESMYIPQGDSVNTNQFNVTGTDTPSSIDQVEMDSADTGSFINSDNQKLMQEASSEVNNNIPLLIKQAKAKLAGFFGLNPEELNKTVGVGAADYNQMQKGPANLFNRMTSMWSTANAKINPFVSALPKTLSSGMEGLSRFLAVSMGFAAPEDENIDMTKVVNNKSYMDKRAEMVAASSPFYTMLGGISGSNSNDMSTQTENAKTNLKESGTKKSLGARFIDGIKNVFKGIGGFFGIGGSGSGLSGSASDNNVTETDPSEQNFISQKYSNYAGKTFSVTGDTSKSTVADAGCAPAAATMAINSAGYAAKPITMDDALKTAIKYKQPDGGVTADYFIEEFENHGLKSGFVTDANPNKEKIIMDQLTKSRPVVLLGKDESNKSKSNSPFGPIDHYVVATGLSKDKNNIYVNDPEVKQPKISYNASKILRHSVLGIVPIIRKSTSKAAEAINKVKRALKVYAGRAFLGDMDGDYIGKVARFFESGKNGPAIAETDSMADDGGGSYGSYQMIWKYGLPQEFWKKYGYASKYGEAKSASWLKTKWVEAATADPNGFFANEHEFIVGEFYEKVCSALNGTFDPNKHSRIMQECVWSWAIHTGPDSAAKQFKQVCQNNGITDPQTYDELKLAKLCYDFRQQKMINQFGRPFTRYNTTTATEDSEYYQVTTKLKGQKPIDPKSGSPLSKSTATSDGSSSGGSVIDQVLGIFDQIGAAYGLTSGGGNLEETSGSSGSGYSTEGITGNVSSDPAIAQKQKEVVAQMKSVEGQLKYAQNNAKYPGSRNPDDGSGDCSSTVQWAYNKVMGIDVGSWTGAQETNANTYTAANTTADESKLQLGDIILKDGHVEMYYGDGKMIGHGGGSDGQTPGPTIKNLGGTPPYNIIRRLNAFRGSGSGIDFISQKDSKYANLRIGDDVVLNSGCAPAVATMAKQSIVNNDVSMKDMTKRASNYKVPGAGVSADFFIDEFNKDGLQPQVIKPDNVKNILSSRKPVVLLGNDANNKSKRNSPFGPISHYVLATGISKDNKTIYITDPEANKPNIPYKYNDIIGNTKLAIGTLSKISKSISNNILNKTKQALRGVTGKSISSIVYVGDSRTVGLKQAVGDSATVKFIAKTSMGLSWLENAAIKDLKKIVTDNPDICVIFNFGVNDLHNIDKYIEFYSKLTNLGITNVYYMSVNPVIDEKSSNVKNSDIEAFNKKYQEFANGKYIDTYSYLTTNGFNSPDGLHYDTDTYKKIHEFTVNALNGLALDPATGSEQASEIEEQNVMSQITGVFDKVAEAYGLTGQKSEQSTQGGSTSSGGSLSGNTGEEQTWNYLKGKGIPAPGIAGLMGNIKHESGFQFNNVENLLEKKLGTTDDKYTEDIDKGAISKEEFMRPLGKQYGYGLVQWTYPTRKEGLYDTVKANNASIADPKSQLDWLWEELNNSYPTTLEKMKTSSSVREVSDYVLTNFEAPADQGASVQQTRYNSANEYYNQFNGMEGSGSGLDSRSKSTVSMNRPTNSRLGSTPTYNYTSTITTPTRGSATVVSTKQDNTDKLMEIIVKLLAQVVDNTSSIKDIAALVIKLIDMKQTTSENTGGNYATSKDVLSAKALALNALKQSTRETSDQSIERLIRNVEAIAAQ